MQLDIATIFTCTSDVYLYECCETKECGIGSVSSYCRTNKKCSTPFQKISDKSDPLLTKNCPREKTRAGVLIRIRIMQATIIELQLYMLRCVLNQ